jgi:hypothetical protein
MMGKSTPVGMIIALTLCPVMLPTQRSAPRISTTMRDATEAAWGYHMEHASWSTTPFLNLYPLAEFCRLDPNQWA